MVLIMFYEIVVWEKLFWFLKFLILKFKVRDKDVDEIDVLFDLVDLFLYGFEWVRFNYSIGLDEEGIEFDLINFNLWGMYGGDEDKDLFDEII